MEPIHPGITVLLVATAHPALTRSASGWGIDALVHLVKLMSDDLTDCKNDKTRP
jgi:hypothetical protein